MLKDMGSWVLARYLCCCYELARDICDYLQERKNKKTKKKAQEDYNDKSETPSAPVLQLFTQFLEGKERAKICCWIYWTWMKKRILW
jgi:hypothetical protein